MSAVQYSSGFAVITVKYAEVQNMYGNECGVEV